MRERGGGQADSAARPRTRRRDPACELEGCLEEVLSPRGSLRSVDRAVLLRVVEAATGGRAVFAGFR